MSEDTKQTNGSSPQELEDQTLSGTVHAEPEMLPRASKLLVSHGVDPVVEADKGQQFRDQLDAIIGSPLSAETVDGYADNSLNDLIGLIDQIVGEHDKPISDSSSLGEKEREAFEYYDLGDIGAILDAIIEKSTQLKHLEELISSAPVVNRVIVPPDARLLEVTETGENVFERPKTIPRLKTLLFILQNDFDVNVDDKDDLVLLQGEVSPEQIRNSSYFLVDVPKLNRSLLICDEEGNVTYVFDRSVVRGLGIDLDSLISRNKPELDDLVQNYEGVGQRLVYTRGFVENIRRLITEPLSGKVDLVTEPSRRVSYFVPKAEGDVKALRTLTFEFGYARKTIEKAIIDLGETLGRTQEYRFGNRTATGYNPDQQALIYQKLIESHITAKAPEGVMSQIAIARNLRFGHQLIRKAAEELGDGLGDVHEYIFGRNTVALGYTPTQQAMIHKWLQDRGLTKPFAPEGVLSVNGLFEKLKIGNRNSILAAIEELGDELGDTEEYRFGSYTTVGYKPEQQEQIIRKLAERGTLSDGAPEGVESAFGLARKYGLNPKLVQKVAAELGDQIGHTKIYKFGSRVATGYKPEQQELIHQQIIQDGH